MGRKVKVAVAGAGRAGEVHALNLANRITIAELTAIIDQDPNLASQLAQKSGGVRFYKSLTDALKNEELEAVFITTPTYTHTPMTLEAVENRVHVFCEKPMALNLDEADKMIAAARRYDVKLQIGFMRRFDHEIRKVKSQIAEGAIGRPILVKSLTRGPGLPPPWALDPRTSIGMAAEVNSHDFDTVRWLMDSEVKSVYAEGDALINPRFKHDYESYHDVFVSLLRFENDGLGIIDGSCPVGYGYDARIEVLGTEGLIVVGDIEGSTIKICKSDKKAIKETYPSWRNRFYEAYIAEAESFLKAILLDTKPEVSGEDGKKSLELVLATVESMKKHSPVNLLLR